LNNRIYEVDQLDATHEALTVIEVDGERMRGTLQEDAFSGTAARFFNTKVNVSTQEERILTLLMMGLTFRALYMHVKNSSLSGLPADLTMIGLYRFIIGLDILGYRFGFRAEIINLALPIAVRDVNGLRDPHKEPDHGGSVSRLM
jgi:hypothetical protein